MINLKVSLTDFRFIFIVYPTSLPSMFIQQIITHYIFPLNNSLENFKKNYSLSKRMEIIEQELDEKTIERIPDDPDHPEGPMVDPDPDPP